MPNRSAILPVLLIALGVGWLLDNLHIYNDVSWVWVICLAAGGVLVMVVDGITKSSVVIGPLLIVAAIFALLRQIGRLDWDKELPGLVITLGVLMLIARHPKIKT